MSDPVHTPPMVAGDLSTPPRRAVWPVVIGVIAMVFGALGMLQSLGGLVLPLIIPMMDRMAAQMPAGKGPAINPFAAMREFLWVMVGGYVVLAILAVALLVLGIGLVRRNPWGASGMRVWGVCGIVGAIGLGAMWGFIEGTMINEMTRAAIASAPAGSRPAAPPPELGTVMGIIMGVIVAIVLAILPTFMTIWFSLGGVRAEVATWRSRATA